MVGRHVVLVEDDSVVRGVLTLLLESAGWGVAAAPDGVSGLELIRAIRPDVVVTDLRLPGLTGIELAEAVSVAPPLQSIPVVAITSDSSGLRARAQESGNFVTVLTKPLDPSTLLRTLDGCLNGDAGEEAPRDA